MKAGAWPRGNLHLALLTFNGCTDHLVSQLLSDTNWGLFALYNDCQARVSCHAPYKFHFPVKLAQTIFLRVPPTPTLTCLILTLTETFADEACSVEVAHIPRP